VVETIRLESGHTLTGIVGSNPTLSAILPANLLPVLISSRRFNLGGRGYQTKANQLLRPDAS
jgi:hypothetical protein